ncbi:hypothetical protein F4811DRAFT_127812 [Daldinia bambusicola]|nr:hypothetical protein F4811DRAFT_127812 [Daldinia bambusicola]
MTPRTPSSSLSLSLIFFFFFFFFGGGGGVCGFSMEGSDRHLSHIFGFNYRYFNSLHTLNRYVVLYPHVSI